MELLKPHQATAHELNDGTVKVTGFNFTKNSQINDASIVLADRYPTTGYAVNDVSTVLISIEEGEGSINIKGESSKALFVGDRLIINPREPYYFTVMGKMAIRYIATPAWTPDQARIIE